MATPLLVATAGATTANTYATLAEALAYFDTHLYGTDFTGATEDNQNKALLMATRLLDEHMNWDGLKVTDEQALRHPRSNLVDADGYDIDYTTIMQELKNATAEFAGKLLAVDRTAEDDTKGFKEMGAGTLKLVMDKKDRKKVIPESVTAMLETIGKLMSKKSNKLNRC